MSETRLHHLLHEQHVPYEVIHHTRAITAQEVAASTHIRGDMLAKTVMVKLDGRLAMVVLPAAHRVPLGHLRHLTDASRVELATETDFRDRFPDCEVGAMPPFGHLYDMDVYLDERLAGNEEIAFNDGTHTDLVRMPYVEFERLAKPRHVHLSNASPRM
ncbi:YbaK/EbsC family protein [Oleiagrimonas citrea]|uniref:YbaK/EbsC family protein n=1 Tax=Oleiagrimonas citrea TaxID=1665687 RepID=A0A846ZMV5_9GAMM|nr:YbaK/EbsC family protein [Oleiagrimonas citrea]NKZ38783.1 YbaK/EbsC family protein [Oleiagrimonas citrea]